MTVNILGFFDTPNYQTISLIDDLERIFSDVNFFIVWNNNTNKENDSYKRSNIKYIESEEIIEYLSISYNIDKYILNDIYKKYPLIMKIFLILYSKNKLQIDYAILTDNDIYIFEEISEIIELVNKKASFLIPETGKADNLPIITDLILNKLNRKIFYKNSTKGNGYNIGFCGLNLNLFNNINRTDLKSIIDTFNNDNTWWKDQAFIVTYLFSCSKESLNEVTTEVHTFENQKYMFYPYNYPNYEKNSKIYHCIYTKNKISVSYLFKIKNGSYSYLKFYFKSYLKFIRTLYYIKAIIKTIIKRS
jgi:hypothetical protein